jgi:hypothetical protein
MSTLTILAGFALMVFLPCALAYFSYRDPVRKTVPLADYDSMFASIARVDLELPVEGAEEAAVEQSLLDIPKRAGKAPEPASKPVKTSSPTIVPQPMQKPHQAETHMARIQRAEMEALVAEAAAARAQAHALAANARLAAARAEAADAEATAAEAAAEAARDQALRAA